MHAILGQIYPSRVEAIELLRAPQASASADALRLCAGKVRSASEALGRSPAVEDWSALADAVEIVAFLHDWRAAALRGEAEADRFVRAARLKLEVLEAAPSERSYRSALLEEFALLRDDVGLTTAEAIGRRICAIPFPLAIFSDPVPQDRPYIETPARPDELSVAFLEFAINGEPAASVHNLRPGELYDLALCVRVSRWPAEATSLQLAPVSIEPDRTWDLPDFEFTRPTGSSPYEFRDEGRMIVHASQSLNARPLEFVYAAEFHPTSCEQPVVVAGQRSLRLDGTDPSLRGITGYPGLDRKILQVRDELRLDPSVLERELRDTLTVLAPLANLMGQSLQDARFPEAIDESIFQREVRQFLRMHPTIGVDLEEQAHAGGGRTDLSFRGIRLELKSERKKRLTPADCSQFAQQAASYAIGTGKRLAILCVLDCSPKRVAPFPAEDGLFIQSVDTGGSAVSVVTCLLQGNLARPSDLSK